MFFDVFFPDLDKMDSEKDEMNQTDIAALHHFYARHISNIPDDLALTELFAQVCCLIYSCIHCAVNSVAFLIERVLITQERLDGVFLFV